MKSVKQSSDTTLKSLEQLIAREDQFQQETSFHHLYLILDQFADKGEKKNNKPNSVKNYENYKSMLTENEKKREKIQGIKTNMF